MVNVSDNCIPLDFLGNGHLNVVLVRTACIRVHEQDFETTYTQYVGDELVHVSVSIEAETDALASSVLLARQHKVVLLILLARVKLPHIHLNVVLVCKTHDTSQHAVGYAQSVAECFALGGRKGFDGDSEVRIAGRGAQPSIKWARKINANNNKLAYAA